MDFKSYLRGLGAGIVAATVVLTVSFAGRSREMSSEEIMSRARLLGMTETTAFTQTTTEAATQETESEPETESEMMTETETQTTAAKTITVELNNFYEASVAAELLQKAGVIDDADAFSNYLEEQGYSTRLFEGTYTFTEGMSYEQVAQIISSLQ
jgi:thymidylate synthase